MAVVVGSILLVVAAASLLVAGLLRGGDAFYYGSIVASALSALALLVGIRQLPAARWTGGDADPASEWLEEHTHPIATTGIPGLGEPGSDSAPPSDAAPTYAHAGQAPVTEARDAVAGGLSGRSGLGGLGGIWSRRGRVGVPSQLSADPTAAVESGRDTQSSRDAQSGRDTQPGRDTQSDSGQDPLDEPAPQRLSPQQAARVAVMDADVVVVDGRPRYHLTGCLSLLGREVETLPVAEAVELGFTSCGQCTPATTLLAVRGA
jgi:hypothetical protein